jgi:hypothetical protein
MGKRKSRANRRKKKKEKQPPSRIIAPSFKLVLPLNEFERRMLNHPLGAWPPRSHPAYDEITADIGRCAQMDIGFQARFKEIARRLPLWAFARATSGSGFLMSTTLRAFFSEYLNRLLTHGPHSLPTSFNVVESFLSFHPEFVAFDLREEREHLLVADDYFEWYSETELPRDARLLLDVMQDEVMYLYDMVSDAGGYQIKTGHTTFVLAGVALVRHSNELSCLLVAGENPPHPSDEQVRLMLPKAEPAPHRESLVPDPNLTIKSRYLESFPSYARVHLLTRFDLSAGRYDVRYVNADLGPSYRVLTDDLATFDDLPPGSLEIAKTTSLQALKRYETLFSALASLIYLPIAFVDERDQTTDVAFKTEFYTRQDEDTARNVINEFEEPVYLRERTIKCLSTSTRSTHAVKTIVPPEMTFERDGYWRPLAPGEVGKDKNGDSVAGRTWVARFDSWSAQSPSTFLLQRPSTPPDGNDPGTVYIMRSDSHASEIYKVGLTRQTAEIRAKDLGKTSAPLPFAVLAQWEVGDCRHVEQEVHERLKAYRLNPNREFFHCKLTQIISTVEAVLRVSIAGAKQ